MTPKDYVLIAAALKEARDWTLSETPTSIAGCDQSAYEIATALARDNPRFDRERFLKAAGVQS